MSCQDLCVTMDWDGSNDFYSKKTPRAAKPHRCCECNDTIAVGERYEYVSGKSEGDFFFERTCATCAEIREAFCCGTWVLGSLWESIREQLFPAWDEMIAIDCLANLSSPDAVAAMRHAYAEWQE